MAQCIMHGKKGGGGGIKSASGSVTAGQKTLVVSGLDFEPRAVYISCADPATSAPQTYRGAMIRETDELMHSFSVSRSDTGSQINSLSCTVVEGGFNLSVPFAFTGGGWVAVGV